MLAVLAVLAACGDGAGPTTEEIPETEYVTVNRAWRPGERDSMVAAIAANRTWVFPYLGDISDQADALLDPDSTTDVVPNPFVSPSRRAGGAFGPWFHTMVPGTGWTTIGIDWRMINNSNSPPDTVDWLGWMWSNNADQTWKGFVITARTSGTVAYRTVNTVAFDAVAGDTGTAAGEARLSTGEYWQGDGWVRRNRMRVTGNNSAGSVTTVTTGPYLGGTQQARRMSGTIDSVRLDRLVPASPANTIYASITLNNVNGLRMTCVFPSPCTTNALRQWTGDGGQWTAGRHSKPLSTVHRPLSTEGGVVP